jgi:alanyl-tRNA synthetase
LFKIIGEESVASGTRRITALTGHAALEHVHQEEELLAQVSSTLRVPLGQLGDRVAALLDEIKTLRKQAVDRRAETPQRASVDDLLAASTTIGEVKAVIQALDNQTPDEMRSLIDGLRRKQQTGLAVLLVTASEGKVQLVAGLSRDLVERGLHAGNWLKQVAPIVGGGGGGRPDLAQAGGKDPERIPVALKQALNVIIDSLKS